ncbi:cytochrome b/b6 domain-containing protein [Thermosynechococcaceae cyanobacterium BACA0444]|uniref:Cytochrome b/b6 domain-containing protein n=1 Tax=Pseudocalidococcus azoricus BACA0444 TaxID=2918990 RepID=A0AAE4JW94_9CYAN|nr:cytochrome b/b6 domain-containing protein [Pseudocalidococcus azoricus]MDS3859903.1 cytochrome b/b6 domain-containing protein [Pseudocalidococcus azoricus BACA0444]
MAQWLTVKTRVNSAFQLLMSFHWAMYWCFLILFTTGTIMARLTRGTPGRSEMYDFHKGLGVIVLLLLVARFLVLLRVWWRKYTKQLPKFSPAWWQKFLLHCLLYLLMVVVPLSGLLFSNSRRSGSVQVFGITLPDLFPVNPQAVELGQDLHFWLAYTFLLTIVVHVMAQKKFVQAQWRRYFT